MNDQCVVLITIRDHLGETLSHAQVYFQLVGELNGQASEIRMLCDASTFTVLSMPKWTEGGS